VLGKMILFAMGLGTAALRTACFADHPILTFVYQPEYARHVDLLWLMVVDGTLVAFGSFLGFAMTAARSFRPQIRITATTLVTTVVLTLLLVPHFGLMGAGYGLLIVSVVRLGASI
jgi:O-antigen/teichoic acid export membrane protein